MIFFLAGKITLAENADLTLDLKKATLRRSNAGVPEDGKSTSGVFDVGTGATLYANIGTMNLEASCGIARRWTVTAGVEYNPFSWGEGIHEKTNRQRSLEAGARFWPWHIYSGWWMAGKLKYQEYNRGGIFSPQASLSASSTTC